MSNYDTIWVFLTYLIQRVIFSVSSEEVSFTRFMANCSNFLEFPKLMKDLQIIWELKLKALLKLLDIRKSLQTF